MPPPKHFIMDKSCAHVFVEERVLLKCRLCGFLISYEWNKGLLVEISEEALPKIIKAP